MSKKNGLIEIYRFIFSLFVLLYHTNPFINYIDFFHHGRIVIYFFFLVNGFFLTKQFDRSDKFDTVKDALVDNIKIKLYSWGWPLLVSYIASLLSCILFTGFSNGVLRYLWFLHILLIVNLIYIFLYKKVSKDRLLILSIWSIVIATIVNIIMIILNGNSLDEITAFIYIPAGYLISLIDFKDVNHKISTIASIVTTLILILFMIVLRDNLIIEIVVGMILIPVIFVTTINSDFKSNKLITYLGMMSVPIYVFQNLTRFLGYIEEYIFGEDFALSIFILVLVFSIFSTTLRFNKYKKKEWIK